MTLPFESEIVGDTREYREGVGTDVPTIFLWEMGQTGKNGVRGAGCGVREGVPLVRHEYVWGLYTGEGKTDFGLGISEFGKVCRWCGTRMYGGCAQARGKSPYSRKELGIGDLGLGRCRH